MKKEYVRLVSTLKNVVALDVDVAANVIYWFQADPVLPPPPPPSASLDQASDPARHVTLIERDLHTPQRLALDWIHGNIYWTDSGIGTISVASTDGSRRRTLLNTQLGEPRAIAVDPSHGFVYWSDWSDPAKIERAGLNGGDRQPLVTESIECPNGITLDVLNERLYWVDSKLHTLSGIDLNGGNRKLLLSSAEYLRHPFSLAVFEDTLYWTDVERAAVFSVNRLTGGDVTSLAENLNSPQDIVILHQLTQPTVVNFCEHGVVNGGCEYLCLPAPRINVHSARYTCACSDHAMLAADMRTYSGLFTASTVSPSQAGTADPTSTSHRECPCLCSHSPRSWLHARSHTTLSALTLTLAHCDLSSGPGSGEHSPTASSTGAIVGIIIPIVVLILIILAGFLIWRNWRKRNTKSMNFDNPVYRKSLSGEETGQAGVSGHIGHVYPARVALSLEDDGLP
uniref:Uncharacterized protein n=1 Tax=Callorhinchus milii TaxID=7868 RepID=A0A4W3IJ01_CALMI